MPNTESEQGRRVEEAIAEALYSARERLVVQRNVRHGEIEADFLVETPDARTFLIEVKSGLSASRISSVAQLARYRKEFTDARGTWVIPILVAVGEGATDLEEAAADFGIEVVAGEHVEDVSAALLERLSTP